MNLVDFHLEKIELVVASGLLILIWLIQILHYPSFHFVDRDKFSFFENHHTQKISLIVLPLMLLEVLLVMMNFSMIKTSLLIIIWSSTFFIQVPCHRQLNEKYDFLVVEKLIKTNWIRTLAWTVKFFIVYWQNL